MDGRTFVDTNVFVCLFDEGNPEKRRRAKESLEDLKLGELVISTQVLQEFYATVTRKLRLPPGDVAHAMASLARNQVVVLNTPLILAAAKRSMSEALEFWDALIVEAAVVGECERLLTEDAGLQHGRTFGTLRVENPFLP